MTTSLHDIIKFFDEIAPRHFTVRGLDNYVEIGGQTQYEQSNSTVSKVVITTYPTSKAVTKATQEKANLLISHISLFRDGIDRLSGMNLIKLRLLVKNYISVYILRSSWIAARDGIADAFLDCLELKRTGDFMISSELKERVPIGRVCQVPQAMNHSRFLNHVADKMEVNNVLFTGDFDEDVRNVLVIPGNILNEDDLVRSKQQDIETIVTGEVTPSVRMLAHQMSMNLLELGAFITEEPGMKRLKHQMSLEFPSLKVEFASTPSVSKTIQRK
jgi:putative NIF3 family GTP cyclohydrolase 1 type 2